MWFENACYIHVVCRSFYFYPLRKPLSLFSTWHLLNVNGIHFYFYYYYLSFDYFSHLYTIILSKLVKCIHNSCEILKIFVKNILNYCWFRTKTKKKKKNHSQHQALIRCEIKLKIRKYNIVPIDESGIIVHNYVSCHISEKKKTALNL